MKVALWAEIRRLAEIDKLARGKRTIVLLGRLSNHESDGQVYLGRN